MRFELGGSGMTYEEVMKKAKSEIGPYCKVCPQCNGKACKNQMPGPGAKGVGDVAIRNYDQIQALSCLERSLIIHFLQDLLEQ